MRETKSTVLPWTQSLSVPAVARLINHSSDFQLLLALEGSYVNGNCTEDVDCKENMPASQLSREWSVGKLKINLQTPVNLLKIYATLKMYPTI